VAGLDDPDPDDVLGAEVRPAGSGVGVGGRRLDGPRLVPHELDRSLDGDERDGAELDRAEQLAPDVPVLAGEDDGLADERCGFGALYCRTPSLSGTL
jgi:hypothetical protein